MTDLISNWLPTKEAITLTGLSEARLRKLRTEKKLRFKFMGRIVLYYREDIESLAREQAAKQMKRQEKLARKEARKKPG